jgi:hypothetical protein
MHTRCRYLSAETAKSKSSEAQMGTVARMPMTPLLCRNIRRIRPPQLAASVSRPLPPHFFARRRIDLATCCFTAGNPAPLHAGHLDSVGFVRGFFI